MPTAKGLCIQCDREVFHAPEEEAICPVCWSVLIRDQMDETSHDLQRAAGPGEPAGSNQHQGAAGG
jgi:hypothetical protein